MTYCDPLIEPVQPVLLVGPRGPPPWLRHPNHVPEFDYLINIESFPPPDEFGDSEGDAILEKKFEAIRMHAGVH
jgi:hypothetical protein